MTLRLKPDVTPEEVADQLSISNVLARYSRAVDQRQWSTYVDLFTEDAAIDYSVFGGPVGDPVTVSAFLEESMPIFGSTQHMLGLPVIDVDGDQATAVTPCYNPMVIAETKQIMVCSLWYHVALVRSGASWKISQLQEERNFRSVQPQSGRPQ